MSSIRLPTILSVFVCGLVVFPANGDEKPTVAKTGWIDNPKLEKAVPGSGVIVGEIAFKSLWNSWKLGDEVPAVDFTKELVIVMTAKGEGAFAAIQDKTDLKTTFGGPPKDKPGFAYVVQTVSRTGVFTVNGKRLPKQR